MFPLGEWTTESPGTPLVVGPELLAQMLLDLLVIHCRSIEERLSLIGSVLHCSIMGDGVVFRRCRDDMLGSGVDALCQLSILLLLALTMGGIEVALPLRLWLLCAMLTW